MPTEDAHSTRQPIRSFRNDPADFLPEALGGFVASHPDAEWHDSGFIARRSPVVTLAGDPAVSVISGGGSGHEPMHAGFLGAGMLSAVCPGLMFTSPNAVQITEATRWADQGAGVLHVVKNYTGDVMNFTVARQAVEDVDTRVVLVDDDVATDPAVHADDATGDDDGDSEGPGRRGTGATIIVEKVAGAAAHRGDSLDDVARIGQWVADNSRSMAVALAPGHLPTSGRDTFDLNEGAMEVGVGIHGERGVSREGVARADTIVDRLLSAVTEALAIGTAEGAAGTGSRDEVICLVNGLGGTTPLELSLVYGSALRWLADHGITVRRGIVGTLVTSVNMAGVSLTLTRATDEVVDLLDATTDAPAWPRVLGTEAEYAPASMSFDDDMPTSGGTNEWLSGVVERVKGATDDLTELDRLAGDGDFGTNMDAAFGEVSVPVKGDDAEVLQALSHRLFIRAGGTSGAVLGTLFRELATAMSGDTADADATPAQRLATGLTRAHEAITELGGAKQGDNTLVDALIPAAEAVNGAAKNAPDDMEGALAAGYSAAEKGALSTREMVAKKGRASYLGDASKGVVDPGAIVVAWIFGGSGKVSDFTS
ncbi:dihydroxyacetone kinase family protein [Corynebacterium bovis]|uniref:dihydroxyacetone kinase family protein n=1 Tax=Corynebacterium bovis TaxID=36808 RepID=UPI0024472E21|nr:dihydroxyacetone kinase family protein [Corynebacterium bovis]MDH2455409.1 dihydroxyacetone kinase family protein [Corynebacterium bovis]